MDSTPDQSKVDQMAIVIRYCTLTSVHERLVQLSPIKSHKGESIFFVFEEFLEKAELNIVNCRGKSYDNSSMFWYVLGPPQIRRIRLPRPAYSYMLSRPCSAMPPPLSSITCHARPCPAIPPPIYTYHIHNPPPSNKIIIIIPFE